MSDLRPINPLALLRAYALAAITPTRKTKTTTTTAPARGRRRSNVRRRRNQAPGYTIRPADAPEPPAVADTREDN